MNQSEIKTHPPMPGMSALDWAEADSQKRTGNRLEAVQHSKDSTSECLNGSEIRNWRETILKPGRGYHAQTCVFCCALVESLRTGKITIEKAFESYRNRTIVKKAPLQTPEEQHAQLASIVRKDEGKKKETTRRMARLGQWVGSITGIFKKSDIPQ